MSSRSKNTTTQKEFTPLITAKKHWVVYVIPTLILVSGIAFITQPQDIMKALGALIALGSLVYIIKKGSEKIHLTDEHLLIQSGFGPFAKKHEQIHLYEVFESSASIHPVGKIVNTGTIRTRRRENNTHLKHTNISNAKDIALHINSLVEKNPGNDLNKVYELKEKGIISESEYNLMKLGYVTKHHLS